MTNKKANQEFIKIKSVMSSCKNYQQLKNVLNMIETLKKKHPNAFEEHVRLLYLYEIEEKKYKA